MLRAVLQWGLAHSHEWTIDRVLPTTSAPLMILIDPRLLRQVRAAAKAQKTTVAAWESHALRQVTQANVPPGWAVGVIAGWSHDSHAYATRFMLPLDDAARAKLSTSTQTFRRSAAEVIRQLIAQPSPEDFPPSCPVAVAVTTADALTSAGSSEPSTCEGCCSRGGYCSILTATRSPSSALRVRPADDPPGGAGATTD